MRRVFLTLLFLACSRAFAVGGPPPPVEHVYTFMTWDDVVNLHGGVVPDGFFTYESDNHTFLRFGAHDLNGLLLEANTYDLGPIDFGALGSFGGYVTDVTGGNVDYFSFTTLPDFTPGSTYGTMGVGFISAAPSGPTVTDVGNAQGYVSAAISALALISAAVLAGFFGFWLVKKTMIWSNKIGTA